MGSGTDPLAGIAGGWTAPFTFAASSSEITESFLGWSLCDCARETCTSYRRMVPFAASTAAYRPLGSNARPSAMTSLLSASMTMVCVTRPRMGSTTRTAPSSHATATKRSSSSFSPFSPAAGAASSTSHVVLTPSGSSTACFIVPSCRSHTNKQGEPPAVTTYLESREMAMDWHRVGPLAGERAPSSGASSFVSRFPVRAFHTHRDSSWNATTAFSPFAPANRA